MSIGYSWNIFYGFHFILKFDNYAFWLAEISKIFLENMAHVWWNHYLVGIYHIMTLQKSYSIIAMFLCDQKSQDKSFNIGPYG